MKECNLLSVIANKNIFSVAGTAYVSSNAQACLAYKVTENSSTNNIKLLRDESHPSFFTERLSGAVIFTLVPRENHKTYQSARRLRNSIDLPGKGVHYTRIEFPPCH